MKFLCISSFAAVLIAALGSWFWFLHQERSWDRDYSLVEDGLYIGGSVMVPPPGTQAVLNLCDRKDPYTVQNHLWEPILDGRPDPDLIWLQKMVQFIDSQRRADKTTYIHCLSGMNRSGLVLAAYLMEKHDWTRDQALAFIRSKRPRVQPSPGLLELLAEWELDRPRKAPSST
jgi:hypothetical protein